MTNSTVEALSERDMLKEISPIARFAQGNYLCTCAVCERRFIGDKRATMCLRCAVDALIEGCALVADRRAAEAKTRNTAADDYAVYAADDIARDIRALKGGVK